MCKLSFLFYQFPSFPGTAIEKILGFVNFHRTWNNQPQSYHQTRTGTGLFNVCHIFFWGLVCFCLYSTGEYLCNFYKNIYGPICYFLRFLPLSMPFSTELSFNLFVKRKNVLESQMIRESDTLKIMTMGRGYLPVLSSFILTILKNVSTLDQNYHILKVVSVKTKVVIRN